MICILIYGSNIFKSALKDHKYLDIKFLKLVKSEQFKKSKQTSNHIFKPCVYREKFNIHMNTLIDSKCRIKEKISKKRNIIYEIRNKN